MKFLHAIGLGLALALIWGLRSQFASNGGRADGATPDPLPSAPKVEVATGPPAPMVLPQNAPRQEVALSAASMKFRPGFDESMIGDYTSRLYEAAVVGGAVTREMYGEGYDRRIAELAKQFLLRKKMLSKHSARFCGLDSLDDYDELAEQLNSSDLNLANELGRLSIEADRVAKLLVGSMESGWESGVSVQLKYAGTQDEAPMWWSHGISASEETGLHRQYSSTRVGDRDFYFSFNSADFAGLDHELIQVGKQCNKFWREVRSLRASSK